MHSVSFLFLFVLFLQQQSDKHRVAFIHWSPEEDSLVGRALAVASLTQPPHVTAQFAVDLLADGEVADNARKTKDRLFGLAKGVMVCGCVLAFGGEGKL